MRDRTRDKRHGGRPQIGRVRALCPLERKVLLPVLAAAVAAIALVAFATWMIHDAQRERQLASESQLLAHAIADAEVRDPEALQEFIEKLGEDQRVNLVVAVTGEPPYVFASTRRAWIGRELSTLPPSEIGAELATTMRSRGDAMRLRAADGVFACATPLDGEGAVVVHLDSSAFEAAALRSTVMLGVVATVAIVALAATVVLAVRRTVTLRLARLARAFMAGAEPPDPAEFASARGEDEITALAGAIAEAREREARHYAEIERLALVARRTTNAVIITDLARRIAWVNEGFTRLTGYSAEEAIGRVPGELLQSERTDPAAIARMRGALAAHEPCRVEILNRGKDGHEYWLDIEIQPLRDGDGAVTGFMAIEADVTAAVEAREAIAASERRQRLIVEGADLGTWEWNIATGEVRFNDRWCTMLGYAHDEVEPHVRSWETLIHPDDRAAVSAAIDDHFAGRTDLYRCEHRLRHRDGSTVWILDAGKVYERDASGKPLRMSGIHLDITERRIVEDARARLAEIVEGSEDAILGVALDGTVSSANAAAARLLGVPREEIVGAAEERSIPAAERDFERAALARIAAGDRAAQYESRRVRADGAEIEVSVSLSPVRDAAGALVGASKIVRDVTERREKRELEKLAALLGRQNRSLEEMTARAHRFVDDVSHEFRTPLTVIKEYTAIVADGLGGPVTPQQAEWLQIVDVAAADLNQMVEDFLDSSKLRVGRLRVDRRPSSVALIVAGVRSMVARKAASRGIRVVERVEEGLAPVFVDEEKVRRVVMNLMSNAIKFSPDGGTVELAARALSTGDIAFSVSDQGPGLSPEDQSRLFERFRQLPNALAPSVKGFGLGLNIARQLVWLNLGRIWVESEPGRGATFSFTVPPTDMRVVIERFFERLAERADAGGAIAALRIDPGDAESGGASVDAEQLRRVVVGSTRPSDIALPARGGRGLVLVGPTDSTAVWMARIEESFRRHDLDGPHAPAISVAGFWPYPAEAEAALAAIRESVLDAEPADAR